MELQFVMEQLNRRMDSGVFPVERPTGFVSDAESFNLLCANCVGQCNCKCPTKCNCK